MSDSPFEQPIADTWRPWMRWLIWMLAAVLVVFALRQLAPIIYWVIWIATPFLIALIVAYVFEPIVCFVQEKLHLGRPTGIFLVALALAGGLVGTAVWLLPVLYQQFSTALSEMQRTLPELLDKFLRHHLSPSAMEAVRTHINNLVDGAKQASTSGDGAAQAGSVAQKVLGYTSTILGGVYSGAMQAFSVGVTVFMVVIITFYYLADMDDIPSVIRRLLPERNRERYWQILVKADHAVGGFLRGQLIDCACVGALTTLFLFAIGLGQYALLIGVFAGLMNFIPYLGPVAGATPAILWALTSDSLGNWDERGLKVLLIVGGFLVIQTIDGFAFQPFIVGRHASLHPLLVLLALSIGATGGIGGMILAVPTACFVQVVWVEMFWKQRKDFTPESTPQRPKRSLQRKKKAPA